MESEGFEIDPIYQVKETASGTDDNSTEYLRGSPLMATLLSMTRDVAVYETSNPIAIYEYLKLRLGDTYPEFGLMFFRLITRLLLVLEAFRKEQREKEKND